MVQARSIDTFSFHLWGHGSAAGRSKPSTPNGCGVCTKHELASWVGAVPAWVAWQVGGRSEGGLSGIECGRTERALELVRRVAVRSD